MTTRVHLKSGLSDLEWFGLSIEEAKKDPVGLWEMVKVGRQGFGLDDYNLENFVKDFVLAMVKGGAVPVIGDKTATYGWRPLLTYGNEPQTIAESLVDEWRRSHLDPDVNGAWFAFPSVWS